LKPNQKEQLILGKKNGYCFLERQLLIFGWKRMDGYLLNKGLVSITIKKSSNLKMLILIQIQDRRILSPKCHKLL
jgi:hypothetical protein